MNDSGRTTGSRWYREPWPWLLMLGPCAVIVAGIVTAYLAVRSNDGLVEDDYYKQGLTVNQRTARNQRAFDLGIEAELVLGGDGDRLRAMLRAKERERLPVGLVLRIAHPTRPGLDQKIALHAEGGGVYSGALAPLHGRWHITLEDDKQEWRLVGEWAVDMGPLLRLRAVDAVAGPAVGTLHDKGR
ncbi:MAG: FixH family protein [Candidatus Accumulibacter sp.]|uniref:FixH family protein n=1 Tax=Accumulibacter sp. TaxID=2053492 RepID=UPI00287B0352|nr:FixH family protein [Accumulibacter sp.]MDS4014819.1 FixH family protein [Accumulibacter sp.]